MLRESERYFLVKFVDGEPDAARSVYSLEEGRKLLAQLLDKEGSCWRLIDLESSYPVPPERRNV